MDAALEQNVQLVVEVLGGVVNPAAAFVGGLLTLTGACVKDELAIAELDRGTDDDTSVVEVKALDGEGGADLFQRGVSFCPGVPTHPVAAAWGKAIVPRMTEAVRILVSHDIPAAVTLGKAHCPVAIAIAMHLDVPKALRVIGALVRAGIVPVVGGEHS